MTKRFYSAQYSPQNGESLRNLGKISYMAALGLKFQKEIEEFGFPANLFGLHSLRSGYMR